MKRTLWGLSLGLLVLALAYLLFWPVPVDPIAWTAPAAPYLTGAYAPNTALKAATRIPLPDGEGPEDVAVDSLGRIYAGLADGRILRFAPDGSAPHTFVDTHGRPLGLDFGPDGTLYVADARNGLLAISPDGAIETLSTESDGLPFGFTDDLDLGPDGTIYFSDASWKYGIDDYTLDILESRPLGRLLAYDPTTRTTRTLLSDLHFANGVAVSPDGDFVLVNETSRYRVQRYWLQGAKAGTHEVFIKNLPAFNDGIAGAPDSTYWVAMVSPRNPLIDRLADWPWLRKVILRLPEAIRPKPERYAFVLQLDADALVLASLQDPDASQIATISSVEAYGDYLYLGSLQEAAFARVPLP